MKNQVGHLIISGVVSVLVTSAIVCAQVPKTAVAPAPAVVKQEAMIKDAKLDPRQANVAARQAARKKAQEQAQLVNLNNMTQQIMRQGRPLVRAELIFVRKLCQLDMQQLRRVNEEVEAVLKNVAAKLAEGQQQGRMRGVQVQLRVAAKVLAGAPAKVQPVQNTDGVLLLREELAAVMKKVLTAEQFAHYQAEVVKRDANRKQAAVRYLVDAIDRELYLADQQRSKLTDSLVANWDESWSMSLEYILYGNQLFPMGIDPYVTPILDTTQKKVWQGAQKVGGSNGLGGVWGGFMNDNDGLEIELGEVLKPEPAVNQPVQLLKMRANQALEKAAIRKEAVPKK